MDDGQGSALDGAAAGAGDDAPAGPVEAGQGIAVAGTDDDGAAGADHGAGVDAANKGASAGGVSAVVRADLSTEDGESAALMPSASTKGAAITAGAAATQSFLMHYMMIDGRMSRYTFHPEITAKISIRRKYWHTAA